MTNTESRSMLDSANSTFISAKGRATRAWPVSSTPPILYGIVGFLEQFGYQRERKHETIQTAHQIRSLEIGGAHQECHSGEHEPRKQHTANGEQHVGLVDTVKLMYGKRTDQQKQQLEEIRAEKQKAAHHQCNVDCPEDGSFNKFVHGNDLSETLSLLRD